MALIVNRCIAWSTIIPELFRWLFSQAVFVDSVKSSFNNSFLEQLQIRLVFFCLWVNNQILKYFITWSKVQPDHLFDHSSYRQSLSYMQEQNHLRCLVAILSLPFFFKPPLFHPHMDVTMRRHRIFIYCTSAKDEWMRAWVRHMKERTDMCMYIQMTVSLVFLRNNRWIVYSYREGDACSVARNALA